MRSSNLCSLEDTKTINKVIVSAQQLVQIMATANDQGATTVQSKSGKQCQGAVRCEAADGCSTVIDRLLNHRPY